MYLATDNLEVLSYTTRVFGLDRIIRFARFSQSKDNKCPHNSVEGSKAYDHATDAVSDLMFLILSKKFSACLLPDRQGAQWDGFFILAYHLRQRSDVLICLLML